MIVNTEGGAGTRIELGTETDRVVGGTVRCLSNCRPYSVGTFVHELDGECRSRGREDKEGGYSADGELHLLSVL